MSEADCGRRQLLAWGGALAALAIAPGVLLLRPAHGRAPAEPASGAVRWGFLVDTARCAADCSACVAACNDENGLSGRTGETDAQWIRKVELQDPRTGRRVSLPMMCQHCAQAPCIDVCPTGASFRRADGIVLVDRHTCIGCRYCMMACPYKARSLVHENLAGQRPEVPRGRGCVEGCTLCVQRVDRGERPACVEACAASGRRAIVFGDLNDPASELSRRVAAYQTMQVRADLRLDPAVRYEGV